MKLGNPNEKYIDRTPTKRNAALEKDAAFATSIGLTYGVYAAYRDSGYLETYLKERGYDGKRINRKRKT